MDQQYGTWRNSHNGSCVTNGDHGELIRIMGSHQDSSLSTATDDGWPIWIMDYDWTACTLIWSMVDADGVWMLAIGHGFWISNMYCSCGLWRVTRTNDHAYGTWMVSEVHGHTNFWVMDSQCSVLEIPCGPRTSNIDLVQSISIMDASFGSCNSNVERGKLNHGSWLWITDYENGAWDGQWGGVIHCAYKINDRYCDSCITGFGTWTATIVKSYVPLIFTPCHGLSTLLNSSKNESCTKCIRPLQCTTFKFLKLFQGPWYARHVV